MEAEFLKLSKEKEALSSPYFKVFAEAAEKKLNELNALLMNDDKLLNEDGKRVALERNLWRLMLSTFGIKPRDNALEFLIDTVKQKL